ncbi:TnpR resolvase [Klebsiella pneumoniae]|nr:TnpR resolvase [Klebsiella pneumoniae]SBY66079.1 TnpR resolvase [Klebsiella pneumoniae]SBZ41241.1 TnpR resolvase [Klebsiella pneumoniae]SSF92419.1 TnpR resolvase [Klebsiella pneumoniae]SSG05546.1 TnpR resolvase [Klebsiella pneumoniae]
MGSCAAPSAKGDDKFITTDYLQQCPFAEFERALIRERQREGIALAKQRGAYRGRKKSLSSERIAELRQRVEAGEQKTKLAREFGISRETLYQYLRTDQ